MSKCFPFAIYQNVTKIVTYPHLQSQAAAAENPQLNRQPTQLESFFAVTKSLIIRALVIYFISSFFRRPATTPVPNAKDGAIGADPRVPAWNFFDNGTIFDLYVYISDDFDVVNFDDPQSLCWFQEHLGKLSMINNYSTAKTFRLKIENDS